MIAGNHKPVIRNVDEAMRRRMNLVPFLVTIAKKARDKELTKKLEPEWPGILRWMIDGCLEWQRIGLAPPQIVTEATDAYLEEQDNLAAFLDECCVVAKKESDTIEHLWDGWRDWAEDCGEFVGSKRRLCERLEERGFTPHREGKDRTRGYRGLRCIRENARKQEREERREAREFRQSQGQGGRWKFEAGEAQKEEKEEEVEPC